ncbi:glycerol-3-phosphate responsive antiterminator [Virgibacillus senegalensis]|uniref:glycerol-3-phosphate responsive antiterminator n=1 Tax=Virgibacillus senegalensis TaxID=1499679 RepID=UPI00069D3475|nr:glycerol-3-phosphate responsive antiterminator [Virgibacillus senegalensis]
MTELQGILPAIRDMKDFEKLLESNYPYVIFLETRISQLVSLMKYAKRKQKKVFVHADLIQGLKTDEAGIEFLVRNLKPDGIITTRGNVISFAKKHNVLAVQRLFALDSHALESNIKIINKVKPDYIEVLPGIVPKLIGEIFERTGIPVIAGGLIRSQEDVANAYEGGARAVTTSRSALWNLS